MLTRISRFFLENAKLTFVLIAVIMLFGIGAYVFLPKQYNPPIVAPAFSIVVPTPDYTSVEGYAYITSTLEDALQGLQGIDTIYSSSSNGYVSVMVSFRV